MISIREVAELAGVSAATVSRVMNGTAKVDPEKRERVLRVIEETGFIPNEVARTLFRKSAKNIGLIVPSLRNPYFFRIGCPYRYNVTPTWLSPVSVQYGL